MKKYLMELIRKNKKQKGFTLIEMVVVIAIIVLLLMIIAPNLARQKNNAQKSTDRAFETTLQTQVELYSNEFPKDKEISFEDLKDNGYLTEKQYEKATKDTGYEITGEGIVKKK